MTVDQVVDVICVRDGFVSAARSVHVLCLVAIAVVVRGATCGIGPALTERVLVDMVAMHMMEVTVVQIVDVAVVMHRGVTATVPVLVWVFSVLVAGHRSYLLFASNGQSPLSHSLSLLATVVGLACVMLRGGVDVSHAILTCASLLR
jgi:hypothetical protein